MANLPSLSLCLCSILTRTTQPAHLIAICILSFVLLTVGPDLTTTTATTAATETTHSSQLHAATTTTTAATPTARNGAAAVAAASVGGSTLATLAYLGAFATHFGSQIWMTFVSGKCYTRQLQQQLKHQLNSLSTFRCRCRRQR